MGLGGLPSVPATGLAGVGSDLLHVRQLRHVLAHGDAAAGSLLPTTGNEFQLLEGSTSFIDDIVPRIGAAKQQFNFSTYALQPSPTDGLIRRFLDVTTERARDGLPVTAIVDELGSGMGFPGATRTARRAFIDELRDNRVQVLVKPWTFGRAGLDDVRLGVDHRKLYEIDGVTSYQGGINLVDAWSPWHDMMVRAEGPTSAQAGALLAARWGELGGTVTESRRAILEEGLRRPLNDAQHATWQLTNGNRHRRELSEHFVDSVRSAKDRVWIANPYLADPRAMSAVLDAAEAGRDVRLLLAPKATGNQQAQDAFTDPLRRAWAYALAVRGAEVVRVPEFSHAKGWVIDDKAAVGSFNLDISAVRRHYENMIESNDPSLVQSVEALFQRQSQRGVAVQSTDIPNGKRLDRARRLLHLQY